MKAATPILKVVHRETVSSIQRLRDMLPELQAKYPAPATVTYRRAPRFGGWNLVVKAPATETRTRERGHCQFCGNPQVVKNGVLVKHGYRRPGTGYEVGRCPGAGEKPLQVTDERTHQYLAHEHRTLARLLAEQPVVEAAERHAGAALDASGESSYEANSTRPYLRNGTYASQVEKDAHKVKLEAWAARFPRYVAHRQAIMDVSTNRHAIGQSQAFITHFERLIAAKLVGTPLIEEEVA